MTTTADARAFSFCESVFAGPLAPWHIRVLSDRGAFYGGGIDTPSLCDRVRPFGDGKGHGGWDVRVEITDGHLKHACSACRDEYLKRRSAGA